MELVTVKMNIPEGANLILGQTHFIKTVEDLYEALVTASPTLKFGIAWLDPLLNQHWLALVGLFIVAVVLVMKRGLYGALRGREPGP